MELNLGELSPEDLMQKSTADVAGNDVIGWHEEAYVQHLASLDKVNSFRFAVRVNNTQQMSFYFFRYTIFYSDKLAHAQVVINC